MTTSLRLASLAVLVTGCAINVADVPLNAPAAPMVAKPNPAAVEVFTTGAPDRPHLDVSVIAETWTGPHSWLDQLTALRARAAQLGCDGLVIEHEMFTGTCIVWTAPDPMMVPGMAPNAPAPAAPVTPAAPSAP